MNSINAILTVNDEKYRKPPMEVDILHPPLGAPSPVVYTGPSGCLDPRPSGSLDPEPSGSSDPGTSGSPDPGPVA